MDWNRYDEHNPLARVFNVLPLEYSSTAMKVLQYYWCRVPKDHKRKFFNEVADQLALTSGSGPLEFDIQYVAEEVAKHFPPVSVFERGA